MKLLLIFVSFLHMVVALLDYDQYQLVANEKTWPASNEAHEAYLAYCNDSLTTLPPEFEGIVLTKDDCQIYPVTSTSATTFNDSVCAYIQSNDCPAELVTTSLPNDQTTTLTQTSTSHLNQTTTEASTLFVKKSTTAVAKEKASTTLETTPKYDTTVVKTTQPESATTGLTLTTYETDTSFQKTTKSIQEETPTSSPSASASSTSTTVTEIQLSGDTIVSIDEDTCTVETTTASATVEISTKEITSELIPSSTLSDQTKDATSASAVHETTPVGAEKTLSTTLKVSTSMEPIKTASDTENSSTSMPKKTTTFGVSIGLPSSSPQLPTIAKTNVSSTMITSTTKTTAKPTTTTTKTTRTTSSITPAKTTLISSTKATSPTTIPKTKSTASSSTTPPPTSSTTTTKASSTSTKSHITTEKTTTVTNKPTTVTVSSTVDSFDVPHAELRITTTTEGTTSSTVRITDTSPPSTATSIQSPTQNVVTLTQSQTTSSDESLTERETTTKFASTATSASSYGQTTTPGGPTTSTTKITLVGSTETEVSPVSITEAQTTTPQTTIETIFDERRTTTTEAPKTSDVHVATTSTTTESFIPMSTSDLETTTDEITEETSTTSTSTNLFEDTTLTGTELRPTHASIIKQSTTAESKMPSTATITTTKSDTESSSSESTLVSTTASTTLIKTDGSTSDAEKISKTTTTVDVKTTTGLEKITSTEFNVPSTTDPSKTTEKLNQETTLSAKAITSTTATSETPQSTMKQTQKSDTLETTVQSTTAATITPETTTTATQKSTTTISESTTKSSPSSPSTIDSSSSSSDPLSLPASSSTRTTKGSPSTSQSPTCKKACPSDYVEGQNACFKIFQPNTTDGWQFKDFENACTSQNGIIASYVDFGYTKNMQIFKEMSQNSQSTLVLTNTIPTKQYRTKKTVPAVDIASLNMAKVSIIRLSIEQKYANVSALCRIGKFCEAYTCPIIEYFVPETSQYLEAAVPSTTVLKAGESVNVQCTVTPKRSFNVKCDPRGYLTPDSSMIKCGSEEFTESEPDGVVSSCNECDKFQTTSCDNLGNGSYYCNCKELFFGKSCRFPLNACENFTCENEGSCRNRFTYAYCQCQTSFFGEFCQHNFYNSDEALAMRFMVNAAAVAVIAEHVVRAKKRATPSINGKGGVLPTEVCRYMALFFGTFAFLFRIMLEFPESDSPPEMASCADYFSIMITCVFFALTAMIGEAIISLGVIQNQTTNQFRGQFRRRRNCVKPGKLCYLIAFFGFLAPAVLWQYSQYMVTPRSCVGVVPWPNMAPEMQYAGVALVTILGIYALTGTALAILARFWINHQAYETRRRYDAEFADPWAYGKEVLPVEINVRYCLLAIRPILFAICWCSFIIAAEQMEWWASWTAMACSCLYSAISCVQNFTTIADDLDSTMEFFMKRAPERWAPAYNYITLRTPDEYLQVKNLKKYRKNQEKKFNGGPAICYPIPFDQKIERRLRTSNPKVQNPAALHDLIPTGLQNSVLRKWKRIYNKCRAEEKTPWDAMKEVFRNVHDTRPATLDITPESFISLFRNFKANMSHWDRFNHKNPIAKKIYERGAATLSIMPTYKIQTAELWKPGSNFKQTFSLFHGDPLLNFDQQQNAYDYLEKVCQSISAEDMAKDERETAKFVNESSDLCGRHRDILTAQVINNHRWTLHDFLLDELRPNFIGPRSHENQLAPGVTYLDDTAYYWMKVGEETWKRIQVQSQYEDFNEKAHIEFNLWRGFLPWNLFKRYDGENNEPVPDDAADFPNEVTDDDVDEDNFGPVPEDPLDLPNELNANDNSNGVGNDNIEPKQ